MEHPVLSVGDQVEVRSTFCPEWGRGFVIVDIHDTEYRIKRVADQYVIPGVFSSSMVRALRVRDRLATFVATPETA